MILIILGTVIILWVTVKLLPYQKLKAWKEVKCTINKAESIPFEESQVYVVVTLLKPLIEYSYSYEGREYSSNTIALEAKSLKENTESGNYFWSRWLKGKTFIAYVNPESPDQAILYRGVLPSRKNHYLSLSIVGILLIIIGGWVQYAQP